MEPEPAADPVAAAEAKMRAMLGGGAARQAEQAQQRRAALLASSRPKSSPAMRPGGMMMRAPKPAPAPAPAAAAPPSLASLSDELGAKVLSQVDGGDARALCPCRLVSRRLRTLTDRATLKLQARAIPQSPPSRRHCMLMRARSWLPGASAAGSAAGGQPDRPRRHPRPLPRYPQPLTPRRHTSIAAQPSLCKCLWMQACAS